MQRKKLLIIFSTIAAITSVLIITGLIFQKSSDEKLNGLTDIYDVSNDGTIVYVSYHEGQHHIMFRQENKEQKTIPISEDKIILDIAFSPEGTSFIYSMANKELEDNLKTIVNQVNVNTLQEKTLFQEDGLITEIEYDPKDSQVIFYLLANTFENYSPIARAYPHDFDIYSFHQDSGDHHQYTNFSAYSMGSLKISSSEDVAYIQMFNDMDSESAEEIFDAKFQIFNIPLDTPNEFDIISNPEKVEDIYDFTMIEDEQKVIFQSVSNMDQGGTFEYELFSYDIETKEEIQLTNLKQYTARPIISPDGKLVYFIVNKQFAQKYPDHGLYQMDMNGDNVEEIIP